jgi:hypothetical protein
MALHDYQFVTHWRVAGTADEVFTILDDVASLTRWWPTVYLEVREIEPGDAQGIGKVVHLLTKGKLPYTLRWQLQTVAKARPRTIVIEAKGDFVGRGEWTIVETPGAAGPTTDVTYDWRIRAEKPLLRILSPLLKPIFSANHRWAMARGEESLKRELVRRRTSAS